MAKVTPRALLEMKRRNDKIVALTCYDASMARLLNEQEVDVVLVGDSVGNVKLGYESTLPVTVEEMLIYTKAVKRGNARALLVADMPFLSYEIDPRDAVRQAGRLVKDGGAEAVKVEGAKHILPSIKAMVKAKIPVMGHLGLTPQSILALGGYRVQGRRPREARDMAVQAKQLEAAGVFSLVLEAVPSALARRITRSLSIPTIGIGAGTDCDGQVLVLDDLLGLGDGTPPKFVKRYASLRPLAALAVQAYRQDVKEKRFPAKEHTYD
jgi:3-methyl-2-oxobutanoate hydroxymethyltransferase